MSALLLRFTGEWAARLQPDAMLAVCDEIGYPGWRDRVLTSVTPRPLFLLQMLQGHTACSHLPHLSSMRFRAAASCQARARLPIRCFDRLLTHDLAQRQQVHPLLAPGDGLVADRGLCSSAHLARLVQAGVHAVLRVGAR